MSSSKSLAVKFWSVSNSLLAPLNSNSLTILLSSLYSSGDAAIPITAKWSGDCPRMSWAFTSAPNFINSCTLLNSYFSTAKCKGVAWYLSRGLISKLCYFFKMRIAMYPVYFWAAQCITESWLAVRCSRLTSKPLITASMRGRLPMIMT